jgi:hypothetical protein
MRSVLFSLALLCSVTSLSAGDDTKSSAVQQVWLDTKETPSVLGKGSWTIIPYDEFQKTLALAEQFQRAQARPPWLIDARYEAELNKTVLQGKATWQLHNPHPVKSWAKITPWSSPLLPGLSDERRLRSIDDGKGLAVLVEPLTSQPVSASWQLTGEERPEGLWFSAAFPSSPGSSLTITLPSTMILECPANRNSIVGPVAAEPDKQRWQVCLSGTTRPEWQFLVRQKRKALSSFSSEVKLDGDFVVTETMVRARYEIDIQSWHERLRQVKFTLDEAALLESVSWKQLDGEQPVEWKATAPGQVNIALPNAIEQRARLLVQASWKRQAGERLSFPMPHFPESQLTRSTLRIVSNQSTPLVAWEMGDYIPLQGPSRSSALGADVYTFQPLIVQVQQPLRPPSANRISKGTSEVFSQDHWWQIGKAESLMVRCHLGDAWQQADYLSWKVPAGWRVQDVVSDPVDLSLRWSWKPEQPLEVQLAPMSRPEPRKSLLVTLKRLEPLVNQAAPGDVLMPTLEPIKPASRWVGTYGISLDRTLLPPAISIIKAPGSPALPSSDSLWTQQVPVIDWYWSVKEGQGQGSLQWQPWSDSVSQQFLVKATKYSDKWMVKYRVTLKPLAGAIHRWPIQFSSAVGMLTWKSSDGQPVSWKSLSPTSGEFHWEDPLIRIIELETEVAWDATSPVPLLQSQHPFSGVLETNLPFEPTGEGLQAVANAKGQWRYHGGSSVGQLVAIRNNQQITLSPRASTRINEDQAETFYQVTIPAHAEPLQLQLPALARILAVQVQGQPQPALNLLKLEPSDKPTEIAVLFRVPVMNSSLTTSWQPVLPTWSPAATADIVHQVSWPNGLWSWNSSETRWQWIRVSRLLSLSMLGIVLVGLCIFLLRRRQLRLATLLLLTMGAAGVSWADDEPGRTLVYILPGERGTLEGARVIAPANWWSKLRSLATQRDAGQEKPWWVERAEVEATFLADRLRFTAKVSLHNTGSEPIMLPWLQSAPPSAVELDGKPLQPSFVRGPFGLQQISLRIPAEGQHQLSYSWEQPFQSTTGWQSVSWRWPIAPVQTLRVTNPRESLSLKTGSNSVQVDSSTQVMGAASESKLYWSAPNDEQAKNLVDVGVLWEHRPLVSTAHAVLRYELVQPVSQLVLALPANLHVKNINLVGELASLPSPRLRRWRVVAAGTMQQLVIDLQRPVLGTVHLLLELPWQRNDKNLEIPLASVDSIDIPARTAVVGFLADGVEAQPASPLSRVAREDYAFVRPWLPSFSSLPVAQITSLPSITAKGPAIALKPLNSLPHIRTQTDLWLLKDAAEHRINCEVELTGKSLVFLQATVDAGLSINSIHGEAITSWQQSNVAGSQVTQLQLWLDPRQRSGTFRFQIIASQPLEKRDNRQWLLPWKQLKWLHASTTNAGTAVHAEQPNRWSRLEPSAELRALVGPWQTSTQLLEIMPASASGQGMLLEEASQESLPVLSAQESTAQQRWTLTAPLGQLLPAEVELIIKQSQLEADWQFTSSVPLITRVKRNESGDLHYTILFSKPANSLQLTSQTLVDQTGKTTKPVLQFFRWPGLQVP